MIKTASRDELSINELGLVSGGSLPLPVVVATIVRDLVHDVIPPPRPPIGPANGGDGTGPLLPY
jgi:hypothetical protein